jgi:hypothetical protein
VARSFSAGIRNPQHYQTSTAQTLDERRVFNGTALPPL